MAIVADGVLCNL